MRRARPLRATWIISPDVVSPIDSPRAAQRKKECHVRRVDIDGRRASTGVAWCLSKSIEGTPLDRAQYRRMHASSPPAAGALCITGQRRRLTAASRIVINIETPRVGFSWTERAKKKGVAWSRGHDERKKRARGRPGG